MMLMRSWNREQTRRFDINGMIRAAPKHPLCMHLPWQFLHRLSESEVFIQRRFLQFPGQDQFNSISAEQHQVLTTVANPRKLEFNFHFKRRKNFLGVWFRTPSLSGCLRMCTREDNVLSISSQGVIHLIQWIWALAGHWGLTGLGALVAHVHLFVAP